MRVLVLVALLGAPVPAAAQAPVTPGRADVTYRPPASIRAGKNFRVDFHARFHTDFRRYSPELPLADKTFAFRRARIGAEGRVLEDFEYDVEYEVRDSRRPWRNVFVNYRRWRSAEFRVGRFKVPFGREQLTGIFNITFVERSLIASQIAPGRDTGAMVHGRLAHDVIEYATGVFRHDGDNTRVGPERVGDGLWAGRVLVVPWAHGRRVLRHLEFGGAATLGRMGEGLIGIPGRTLAGYVFSERVYIKGRRLRTEIEGGWRPGPFSFDAVYNRLQDERNRQGLGDVDLPDALAQGWSLTATWVVTGESKAGGIEPRHPLLRGGAGAVELAARIEALRFGSRGTGGEPPFANPRSANILENEDRVLTLGVSWYLNRFARVVVNTTREEIEDPERSPILGRTRFWGAACRLQLVL